MGAARAVADVVVRCPGEVEVLRVVEVALVAVGAVAEHHDLVASCDRDAADFGVLGRHAAHEITGLAHRTISSAAVFAWASESLHHRSRWSGCRVSSRSPWLIVLRVVSLPAVARRMKNDAISSDDSWSPSTSALTSAVHRSARG